MADTIPDVIATKGVYVSLNTLSSIGVGTALLVTNKGTGDVRLQVALTQPADGDTGGELLKTLPYSTAIKAIPAGENTVWAMLIFH